VCGLTTPTASTLTILRRRFCPISRRSAEDRAKTAGVYADGQEEVGSDGRGTVDARVDPMIGGGICDLMDRESRQRLVGYGFTVVEMMLLKSSRSRVFLWWYRQRFCERFELRGLWESDEVTLKAQHSMWQTELEIV